MGVIGISLVLGAVVCFIVRPQPLLLYLQSIWRSGQMPRLGNSSADDDDGMQSRSVRRDGVAGNVRSLEADKVSTIATGRRQDQTEAPPSPEAPDDHEQTTPRAASAPGAGGPVPTLSLPSSDELDNVAPDTPPVLPALSPSAASVPSAPSSAAIARSSSTSLAQIGGAMAPPPRPGLMAPPPPRRPPTLASPSSSALFPPSSSPLSRSTLPIPNRGGGVGRPGATSSLAAPPTHTKPPSSGRSNSRLVALAPGHSPLDWARISGPNADLRNLPPATPYLRVTPSMLKRHNGRKGKDAWSAYGGRVYNVTPYLSFHPGGEGELLRGAGKDATRLFAEIHPWVNYETMLAACLVGILVEEGDGDEDPRGAKGQKEAEEIKNEMDDLD